MERKIANIDEFQMGENETPILPTGLMEEENLYVLPDGRYLPCGVYRTEDGGSLIYEPIRAQLLRADACSIQRELKA